MAYRRRSYSRPSRSRSNRSYSSRSRRSYSSPRRSSRSYGGRGRSRGGASQTLRLVLQQPGMQAQRPAFGTFAPTVFPLLSGLPSDQGPSSFVSQGAPGVAQGGPGVAGARMVVHRAPRSPEGFQAPPGYRLVRDGDEE